MKKILSLFLVLCIASTMCTVYAADTNVTEIAEEQTTVFNDIENSWAKNSIINLAEAGIVNGVTETEYAPDNVISRAEFLAMMFRILRLSPLDYENIYPDVSSSDWYAEMLQTMYSLNLLDKTGFAENFDGNAAITREEMASMLSRGGMLYLEDARNSAETTVAYSDADEFSDWAKDDIAIVSAWGVMNGKAEGTFGAKDSATRAESAAVIERMLTVFTDAGYDTGIMPWRQAPIMVKASDEIKPGYAFNLYGYGFDETSKVYLEDAKTAGNLPSDEATVIDVTVLGNPATYVMALLPEDATPGVYKIWVNNTYGMSQGFYMNQARPFWVGNSDIYWEGQTVQLIGANFMLDRIGAQNNAMIKLISGGEEYPAEITQLEPYCIRFTIPENMPIGEFKISVCNDGSTWTTLESEQVFSVIEKGEDPYNLGVGWAGKYVYDYKVNVKDFGAKGDGITDDTDAIRAALADIDAHGGGILYLPNGTYNASEVFLPSYTIIEGEDREKTRLAYCGKAGGQKNTYFLRSSVESLDEGYQGLYNFTLTQAPDVTKYDFPQFFFWVGHPWTQEMVYCWKDRTFEGFFVDKMDTDLSFQIPVYEPAGTEASQSWYGIFKKYALMQNRKASGFRVAVMPWSGNYATVRNTDQHFTQSSNEFVGVYSIFENNNLKVNECPKYDNGNPALSQGVFIRSHAYVAHNVTRGTGAPDNIVDVGYSSGLHTSDGEVTCSENSNGGRGYYFGYVTSATTNTITADYEQKADGTPVRFQQYNVPAGKEMEPRWGEVMIIVNEGRGIGQWREVVGYEIDDENKTMTYTLNKPWDIIPDASSRIQVQMHSEHNIIYNNESYNCEGGHSFYSGSLDSFQDGNYSDGCLYMECLNYEIDTTARRWGSMYLTFKNNHTVGTGKHDDSCRIAVMSAQELKGNGNFGVSTYGTEIRDNYMEDVLKEPAGRKPGDIRNIGGVVVGFSNAYPQVEPNTPVVHATLIENNTFKNMLTGVSLGCETDMVMEDGMSGVIVKDNNYINVKNHLNIMDSVANIKIIGQ